MWVELPTNFNRHSDNAYYYAATSSGFSYFAIAAKLLGSTTPLPTVPIAQYTTQNIDVIPTIIPHQDTTTKIPIRTINVSAPVPSNQPDTGIPTATIIVAFVGIVGISCGTFLLRRWWIRRQNPALFRGYK